MRKAAAGLATVLLVAASSPAQAPPPVRFAPYVAYFVGSWPESVAIGDVTGDGRADVLMYTSFYFAPRRDYKLWVFAQNADGSLAAPLMFKTDAKGGNDQGIGIGDLTGDGLNDVVLGTPVGVDLFRQRQGGGLRQAILIPTPVEVTAPVLADVNVDGRMDIVATTYSGALYLRSVSKGFVQSWINSVSLGKIEVGDVTGDGLPDVVACTRDPMCVPGVDVFEQTVSGSWTPHTYPVDVVANSGGIGIGDLTGDGRNDVALSISANSLLSSIRVFPQTDEGELGEPIVYSSDDIPEPVDVVDINLDGLQDVVTLHGGWDAAGVYLQDGGQLGTESLYVIPYASHYRPTGLAVGDINSDGKPDIVLADNIHGLVVLRQL